MEARKATKSEDLKNSMTNFPFFFTATLKREVVVDFVSGSRASTIFFAFFSDPTFMVIVALTRFFLKVTIAYLFYV